MSLQLGDTAPNFDADTTEGKINFHDWLGDSWGILFSHPADFTPVCTTELGEYERRRGDFEKRNVKFLAISVDTVDEHNKWKDDVDSAWGQRIGFPIIGDTDRKVSDLYGMIHPGEGDTSTVRCVYLIDPNKKVRMNIVYPKSAGRNLDEILRVVDSIQLTDNYSVSTPVNWEQGDDVVISPALSAEEAKQQFPDGWKELTPYLRLGKQPKA